MSIALWQETEVKEGILDWGRVSDVRISETVEAPLVEIIGHDRLRVDAVYYDAGIEGALAATYTRQPILEKLEQLLTVLPENIGILVLDAWRPLTVQKALRAQVKTFLEEEYSTLDNSEVEEVLSQFVAEPSDDPRNPSPHLTGGAIDVTLFDCETGEPLDMGTLFDEATPLSWSHAFESVDSSKYKREIRDNRRLLINGMKSVGFTNLPTEWWHFDYGNQLWGYHKNEEAIYGIATL